MITVGKNVDNKVLYGTVHFLCDYQSDVANLPTNRKPGSSAYVIDTSSILIMNGYCSLLVEAEINLFRQKIQLLFMMAD